MAFGTSVAEESKSIYEPSGASIPVQVDTEIDVIVTLRQ
jgi:hypothetical protein